MTRRGEISLRKFQEEASKVRKDILDISFRANVGHIAPALSVADVLTVLYNGVLNVSPRKIKEDLRDRFILSKGHAVAALYAVLYSRGFISREMLMSYCRDDGEFGCHPEYDLEIGVELSTGSLGHGLSVGVGMALGLKQIHKRRSKPPRVFVLISDAELNEGSTWEAIMFAAHHKVDNLVVVVDDNGLQALGETREILDLQPIKDKFQAFGWNEKVVDGHNYLSLKRAFGKIPFEKGRPSVVVAKVVGGKGVSFMENNYEWHYLSLNREQYNQALKEVAI